MARVLLLLPTTTYRAPDFVDAARSLGVEVVVGGDRRQALADGMGDRAVVVPLADVEAAVAAIGGLHERSPIDAVVAVDDAGVLVAAAASERLGLRGNPPEAAGRTRDKAAMRGALDAAGVAQPVWRLVPEGGGEDEVAAAAAEVGLPCVVKPLGLSASRGVIRADDAAGAIAAARRARRIVLDAGGTPGAPLLVERFVPGTEVAVEALLDGGSLGVLATFDKPDPLDGPYFEETLYVTPSRQQPEVLAALHALVAEGAAALGLQEGPVHAEARIRPDGSPVLLEIAARTIGGLCGRTLRFGLGVRLEELVLRHALGLPFGSLRPAAAASGVLMLPIAREGALEAVDGVDEARAVPGVVGVEVTVPVGERVAPLPEGDRYLGFAFAAGADPWAVEAALREAGRLIRPRISPGGAPREEA